MLYYKLFTDQVRFIPADPESRPGPDSVPAQVRESLSWQVDGSVSNNSASLAQGATHLTMREYDDQLNSLKKENLNLKLRIYFMEEQQGMLTTKNSPENVYKVNIDLKVHGEEMKKVENSDIDKNGRIYFLFKFHIRSWKLSRLYCQMQLKRCKIRLI